MRYLSTCPIDRLLQISIDKCNMQRVRLNSHSLFMGSSINKVNAADTNTLAAAILFHFHSDKFGLQTFARTNIDGQFFVYARRDATLKCSNYSNKFVAFISLGDWMHCMRTLSAQSAHVCVCVQ